jgi:hypothetical protein
LAKVSLWTLAACPCCPWPLHGSFARAELCCVASHDLDQGSLTEVMFRVSTPPRPSLPSPSLSGVLVGSSNCIHGSPPERVREDQWHRGAVQELPGSPCLVFFFCGQGVSVTIM